MPPHLERRAHGRLREHPAWLRAAGCACPLAGVGGGCLRCITLSW